jgi:hypothetical protein
MSVQSVGFQKHTSKIYGQNQCGQRFRFAYCDFCAILNAALKVFNEQSGGDYDQVRIMLHLP